MTGRVLLLRALGLGDFLTGVPAYRAVRRAFPGHLIVLAAPGGLADLVPLTGAIDELLPAAELEPVGWTGAAPDVAIDLHGRGPGQPPAGRDARAAAADHLRGPSRGRLRRPEVACRRARGGPLVPALLGIRHPRRPRRPAAHGGARHRAPAPSGALPPAPGGPGLTIVHPGAAAPSRRWPPGRFAAVAGELARLGHQVVVTGSAAERPLAMDVARRAGLPPQSVLAGRTSLAALAALTASARLVVSGDTGLAHLATAYARPSVVLFGPVPPAEWGPPADPRHQALWAGGDGYRGDPHGRRTDPALAAIGVSDVLRAAERALAAARPTLTSAVP